MADNEAVASVADRKDGVRVYRNKGQRACSREGFPLDYGSSRNGWQLLLSADYNAAR